jgi:flagellar hook-length control protein FliK
VKPQTIGIDVSTFMAYTAKKNGKSASTGAFDELFSRLSKNPGSTSGSSASTSSAAASAAAKTSASKSSNDPLPTGETPAALFEQTVAASGTPAEKITMAGSDRSKLEDLLSRSGYEDKDIKQILDQATGSDGSINLGAMFSLMHRYIPTEGPSFFLKVEDKPLLIQTLKGLGVPEDEINKFMDGLQVQGDRLLVKGLPSLLAKVGSDKLDKGQEVDKAVLGDLLGKLGLSQSEVTSLLNKGSDGQDRIKARAVLAMLQQAANTQDGEVASYLKDLAQRVRFGSGETQQGSDASKLRAQFIKLFQNIEEGVKDQALSFKEAMAVALQTSTHEEKAQDAAFRMVDSSLSHNGQVANDETPADTAATPAASPGADLEGGLAQGGSQGQGNESMAQGRSSGQTGQGGTNSTAPSWQTVLGGAEQATGSRSLLPTYVVRQVAEQMTQMVAKQQTSLQLSLKPPTLGELNVEISVKDGVVKATMVAESVAAKQALEAGMEQLKSQLASQGLKLERVDITINPDAQRQQAQAQEQDQFARGGNGSGQRSLGGALGIAETDADALLQSARGGGQSGFISVFA